MSDQEKLWIVAEAIVEGSREVIDTGGDFGSRGGISEKVASILKKRVPLDAQALKTQMNSLLKVVGELFEQAEQQTGMKLNEVELSVEINAEGQVSLVGTGGKLGNKGGITSSHSARVN